MPDSSHHSGIGRRGDEEPKSFTASTNLSLRRENPDYHIPAKQNSKTSWAGSGIHSPREPVAKALKL